MNDTKITLQPTENGTERGISTHPRWQWTIEHDGHTVRSGERPGSGPYEFQTLDAAADNAVSNFGALRARAREARQFSHASATQQPDDVDQAAHGLGDQ